MLKKKHFVTSINKKISITFHKTKHNERNKAILFTSSQIRLPTEASKLVPKEDLQMSESY